MLLRPTEKTGDLGKQLFVDRFQRFLRGDLRALLEEAAEEGRIVEAPAAQRKHDEETAAKAPA